MSVPSWKWLSSRPTGRQLAAARASGRSPARPCLPMVEPLGDRIMLSVAPAATDGPPPIDQVLIGLIKGELKLATSELAALKLAGGEDPQLLHKLTEGLLKVDDVLIKIGEDVIKGELTDQKQNKALALLESEFLKIDEAITGASENTQEALKAAIEGIKLSAGDLLGVLSSVTTVGDLSHKEQQLFLKIADTFGDVDAGLLKIEEAILARKGKGDQEFLVIKLTDVLVNSYQKLSDEGLKEQLSGIVADTEKILIGLLQPAPTGGDVIG